MKAQLAAIIRILPARPTAPDLSWMLNRENQPTGKPLWNHNHENINVTLILICTFKNSYSSSFFLISRMFGVTVGPGISISNHCSGRWEWWKARGAATLWSVFSQDPTTTNGRETTTTNGRDLTTTRPACAPSITRPWIMECEKKLLKIRSEHWNLGEWCVMVHRLSFENIWLPREVAWDFCLRHALLSFKLPLENLFVDCQQPGELVPTASWYFLAILEIC